jgi:exopolyphosphatase/guanosine-5'-triphosphate,3'-diphosphate pyrophosphatase
MILAGIDIGTNTLRLLVAETGPGAFRELYSDRKITRLGQDLDRTAALSRDAVERSIAALMDFSAKIREYSAVRTAAMGTSALRNAANAGEFIGEAKQRTGIDIAVITGENEARLTLLGVAGALKAARKGPDAGPLESALVIDIGGGSTELIVTSRGTEPEIASLPLGAVYLTERFIRSDPPSAGELNALRRAVRSELDGYEKARQRTPGTGTTPARARVCAGTAGTITTLAAMDQGLREYDPARINGFVLRRASLDAIIDRLSASTLAMRREMAGLERGREDIVLAGAVVAQEIMERYGYPEMLVSDWGLREGIVLDLYEKVGREQWA